MKHLLRIAVLGTAALIGQAFPSHALGFLKALHPKEARKNQELISSCVQRRAWMAYFQDGKGGMAPVRNTMDTSNDEDWIGLQFTDYDGPRIRLGVLTVINKAPEANDGQGDKIQVPVAGIQEMLTTALYGTRRFDVIEQKRIAEVEHQQERKDVEQPSPDTIVNIGKVLGAQYLVYGTVNEWNPDRGGKSMGPAGLFKGSKSEAEVAITFALTDVANGQILFTTSERARLGSWSFDWSVPGQAPGHGMPAGPGGGGGSGEKTPTNYVIQACANKAAFKIATFLHDQKWKGSVVEIKKADYYINAGKQQGMAPQAKLSVLSVNGIIRDRENGTVLGEDTHGIGTLEVVTVQNGFSIARIVEGCKDIKMGDRVELATDPIPPPSIPECANLEKSR
jgi:curli biogenesis system outer membrane secretion channel CsgG